MIPLVCNGCGQKLRVKEDLAGKEVKCPKCGAKVLASSSAEDAARTLPPSRPTPPAEDAETLLRGDPFHAAGVFVRWTIRPWNPVMANRELFPAG